MNLVEFRALFSVEGEKALLAAGELHPKEKDFLAHFQALSRRFPSGLARSALEIAVQREKAALKFPFAAKLYLTREALEQASSWAVAAYRAKRYQGFSRLIDLGCSVGCDSLALAQIAPTLGVDIDPLRLAMAQANLRTVGALNEVGWIQADLMDGLPLRSPAQATGLFFDPARRAGHRRIFHVEDYSPPLAIVRDWLADYPALGVKLSPGVKLDELSAYPAEIEFISLNGELKEAVLWFGPLHSAHRRATLLPGEYSLAAPAAGSENGQAAALSEPQAYLLEPDPAVIRAGLVRPLADQLGAAQLDPDIAYLTSDRLQPTSFARVWRVEAWFPFNLKKLRSYLRRNGVGRVTVKKRGSPLQPEDLIRDLRLRGEAEKILILTHLKGEPIVIVASNW